MSGKIVRRVNWTWAWNIDHLERWLEGLAAKGLHLYRASWFGAHRFVEGEPKQVRYRLDFSWGALPEDYEQLIREAGWERVDSAAGWHYWRTEEAAAPEIFTDGPSKAAKFHRLRLFMGGFALWEVVQLLRAVGRGWEPYTDYLRAGMLVFCIYCLARFTTHIRSLEREHHAVRMK